MSDLPATNLTMLSLVKPDGELELSFERRPMPEPGAHEVLVRVLATPINPSDMGLLFGAADMSTARMTTRDGLPLVTADIPAEGMHAMAGRVGVSMPVGNEGCGIVVKAGEAPEAQALIGKMVAMIGGEIYAEYRCLPAMMCMALPDGTEPEQGASCFVNPLTSLAFIETMKMEGHSAMVHAAAASNLGQMLVRICAKDGIPLVNIVRGEANVEVLKGVGAIHIVNSSAPDFADQLRAAIIDTGATLAFDPIGGGELASQILAAMEFAALQKVPGYSRYGSETFKQIYVYGGLDGSPTILNRDWGLAWSVSGFLLTNFLKKVGMETHLRLRKRIVDELTTTFASRYSHRISLVDALNPDVIADYNAKRTGEKYLIRS